SGDWGLGAGNCGAGPQSLVPQSPRLLDYVKCPWSAVAAARVAWPEIPPACVALCQRWSRSGNEPHQPFTVDRRPGRLTAFRAFCFSRGDGMKTKLVLLAVVALLVLAPRRAAAQSINGLWDAKVVVNGGVEIPFRMELSGTGVTAKGSFFN